MEISTAPMITAPPIKSALPGVSPKISQGQKGLSTESSMTIRVSVTAGTDRAPRA